MKGTRLWQNTGSPLISGRSRRERPFLQQALAAWLLAVSVMVAFMILLAEGLGMPAMQIPDGGISGTVTSVAGGFAYAAVPTLIGSLFGVWLARNMGWRRPWIAGAGSAVLAGFVWLALSALWL